MKKFLKPGFRKLLLFSVFILIAVGGQIQAWGFDDDPQTKPPLYDFLRPYPFWLVWGFSIIPLIIISTPFRSLIQNINSGLTYYLWWIGLIVYYYILSCFFFYLFDLFKSRTSR
ncbi:MAG: hypothetical protein KME05_21320 [Gloeocapsa sp. UFS-A4-WI-NPMV-4B04]|jgi:hypothetical protein|nr:hypothetical protein [Gloeocapsa sp. UFS-A4-WI-NPMV-4B04]